MALSETAKKRLLARVTVALESVRPALQSDGGDVEIVDIDAAGIVKLRLSGACIGCPSSDQTLSLGIERTLREKVPEVTGILCV